MAGDEQDLPVTVVALTAYGDAQTEKMCYDAGMSEILLKPASIKDITAVLRRYQIIK